MTTWPLLAAFLLSPPVAAPGRPPAASPRLLEHAPLLRLDEPRPAEPSRRYRARRLRDPPTYGGRVLPGERLVLGLAPVAAGAQVRALLDGGAEAAQGLVPLAWEQSRRMVPDGSSELVAELLVPPSLVAELGRHAAAIAARLLAIEIPERAPAGALLGRVLVDGETVARLELEVLDPLPAAPPEPVLAFYRGRLVEDGAASWPETVDGAMLREDLRLLHAVGVTHVTDYGGPETLEAVRSIAKEAGFDTEPILVGWYPSPVAELSEGQVAQALRRVERLRRSEEGSPRAFWVVDEPIREELLLARKKAAIVHEGGGLATATLQVETARALRHAIDLPLIDNYLAAAEARTEAVRSVRAAGSTPWGYWQSFGESERFARWNAGFRQLAEPTRGQCFYAYAHAVGEPFDDFDGGYRDMLMVYPLGRRRLLTLQLEGLRRGLADLALARGAQALLRQARLDGRGLPAVPRLERRLERASRRWSAARSAWGRYSWEDVARPGRDGGPSAAALEDTRQDILEAVAALQAARRESRP